MSQKGDAFKVLFRVNAHNRLEVCYLFLNINYNFDVSLCSSFINSLVNNANTLFFCW